MSALIAILSVFMLVLVFSRRFNLGYCLLGGSAVLAVFSGMEARGFAGSLARVLSERGSLELIASILLILILSEALKSGGQLERLVEVSRRIFHDLRLTAFVMPALIGLLPMPGGAHFSAPMVDSVFAGVKISPVKKAFANYWFRHVWEYVNPVYPGIVALAALTGLQFGRVAAVNFLLTLAAIAGGVVITFAGGGITVQKKSYGGDLKAVLVFFRELSPVIVVITLAAFFGVHMAAALVCGLVAAFVLNKAGFSEIITTFRNGFNPRVLLMLAGIIAFKNVVGDSGIVEEIAVYMSGSRIGVLPVIFGLSFLSGFVTGITIAFVGTSLPIVMTMLEEVTPWNMMFVFASGFGGVLLSPVHLCLLLSNQYFKVNLPAVYRYLGPAAAAVVLTGLAGYLAGG